jgi:hypothetical protein
MNAIIFGLLTLALFWKVGDIERAASFNQALFNWVGLSFMLTNNMMFPSIGTVVMQMPLQVPVFKREIANRMYTPTVYYFGRILSGILL